VLTVRVLTALVGDGAGMTVLVLTLRKVPMLSEGRLRLQCLRRS
jgi:hypothetical protein